jgi:FkbM family methyltransferase
MTQHHPIFATYDRVPSVASGQHVYDFLGVRTDVAYKKGWAQHAPRAGAQVTPGYPPLNEHYFDWIATLQSVRRASGTLRMAELGAGWAPWLVRAAAAARQCPTIGRLELLALEADETHHRWVQAHFAENGVAVVPGVHLLRGALAAQAGTIRFPRLANPDEDYGASTRGVRAGSEFVEVPAYSMADVLARFSGPVDFVHVDVQGAEYDALPPAMDLLARQVRAIMVGTHIAGERHVALARSFAEAGWIEVMNYPRNETVATEFGEVTFGDGFLYYRNPAPI